MSVERFQSPLLKGVFHGFLGRRGGVSLGDLAGLNVGFGSNDDRVLVAENRRRASNSIAPGAALVTVHQVHSATAVVAAAPWPLDERPHADALVTDRPGLLLGIVTADCAPILLADRASGVIGAAHAGWRGALAGVAEKTIAAMERIGAHRSNIKAIVGPCIAQASYEVDDAFRDRFLANDRAYVRFFTSGPAGKPHFDLPGFVLDRFAQAGIGGAEALGLNTYADPGAFYSYRRSTHLGEADYGRQLSAIALP
ncbi:MAG: peptidoglycan editing factor PgeF [Sphingomonas sp.]|nr:peptidoglycan editing factor PgeF [Sphingomonas sp.]